MTLNDTMLLISFTAAVDADGYGTPTETTTEVMCDSGNGVTRAEYYEAMQAGIQMSAAFEMWACDYGGQKIIEHDGKRYKVERAFPLPDGVVQLNCSEVMR